MQDNQLIDDLVKVAHWPEVIEKLVTHNIKTYTNLLDVLCDLQAEPDIRVSTCWAIFALSRSIDRRRAVPALLKALQSPHRDLRHTVIRTLGHLSARRAVKPLMTIGQNQIEDAQARYFAVEALGSILDERAKPMLQSLVLDKTDNVYVRSASIEWAYLLLFDGNELSIFDKLLSDPSPDIRFWTAFALANLAGHRYDIAPTLSRLDHIAAFDHTLPEFRGWHVDREALAPLEHIHFQPYRQYYTDERGYRYEHSSGMLLISPTPEYERYLRLYRKWKDDWRYTIEATPSVDLQISPEWLKEQLQARWQHVSFDVRTDTRTYMLSWVTPIEGYNLLGGLHRDGYAVVVTGNAEATYQFALWYRSVIADHDLYLYEWASLGIRLHYNMTLEEVRKAISKQYSSTHQETKQSN